MILIYFNYDKDDDNKTKSSTLESMAFHRLFHSICLVEVELSTNKLIWFFFTLLEQNLNKFPSNIPQTSLK